jgi:hypothetical protein
MGETLVQKHLAVQDLTKLKVEELTPLTPEVISRQVRGRTPSCSRLASLWMLAMSFRGES